MARYISKSGAFANTFAQHVNIEFDIYGLYLLLSSVALSRLYLYIFYG